MIADRRVDNTVTASSTEFAGRVWDVRREDVHLEHGEVVTRDYIAHPGAVGIIALNSSGQMLLIEQYRHPMGMVMWEPPAGLLDSPEENPLTAAARELLEETGYTAEQWNVLFDMANSPGGSSEAIRCYLAQELEVHPDGRPDRDGEEKDMPMHWVDVSDVIDAVRQGLVANPILVTGTYALLAAMADPNSFVRDEHAAWPTRMTLLENNRVFGQ